MSNPAARDEYEQELRIRLPRAIRRQLLARGGHKCVYCGANDRTLHLDHVVPHCEGGPTYPSNLVVACDKCNGLKSAMPVDLFAVWLQRRGHGSADTILLRVGVQLASPLPILE